ncbi:ankyrin repeat domain-containing protein SOWAHA [Hoplias malabaricus]|uniref:ankyrin repeat domain-containing protein SOWAHA n=1 Tax=Hoplias malabaricus TaxID=27720 RepID=UPI003461A491
MAVSQGLVLGFLLERGGKVRNSELLGAFRDFINASEDEERRRNRDLFKNFVNNVAVVKQIDELKYVVVKKKYQDLAKGEKPENKPQQTSFSKQVFLTKPSTEALNNNNNDTDDGESYSGTSPDAEMLPGKPQFCLGSGVFRKSRSSLGDSLTATVLNVSDGKVGKTGPVFAVVAVKSPPPQSQSESIHSTKVKNIRAPRDPDTQQQIPVYGFARHPNNVNLYRSLRSKRRLSLGAGPPKSTTASRPGSEPKDQALIPLDPGEHDWLVKSSTGRWGQIYSLLLQDVHLVEKRSFISGFTVLHWAAKKGNGKMLRQILDVSRQQGVEVDVNSKSNDGYTPLHIAAIHSHEPVLKVLVHIYGANCNIRDNSGKKPHHYLSKDASLEVREMLGDPLAAKLAGNTCSEDDPKSFSTISKLFQPSTGHRKKPRHRPSFHFLSYDHEENRRDCATFNRRPQH